MSGGQIFLREYDEGALLIDDDPIGQVISVQVRRRGKKRWTYVDIPYGDLSDLREAIRRVQAN